MIDHENPDMLKWVTQALEQHENPDAVPHLERARARLGELSKIGSAIRELIPGSPAVEVLFRCRLPALNWFEDRVPGFCEVITSGGLEPYNLRQSPAFGFPPQRLPSGHSRP